MLNIISEVICCELNIFKLLCSSEDCDVIICEELMCSCNVGNCYILFIDEGYCLDEEIIK